MSRRLSALQAHLNPAALAASAALQEKPRKPAPLYIESVPKLLTDEQKYEFDLRGFCVLRQHYSPEQVAQFNRGIDELQAIPIDFDTYRSLGVASHALAAAMENQEHAFWKQGANSHDVDGAVLPDDQSTIREPVRRVDMGICGTALWDPIVTDPVLNAIHCELAGGPCFISATYYIEKQGPASGGGLHNGGFPKDKNIYYDYDHRSSTFSCSSTKSVTILSDMSQLAGGPFAAIPGSHKSNFRCPFNMGDATKNPMAVPVYASPGDVILFTEGMTHNAYPVIDPAIRRRSIFFCYMPAISSDNLPLQRMSIYPQHVLDRLPQAAHMLTSSGYI